MTPAQAFSAALELPGWAQRSIVGWDPGEPTWWAQLWPDGDASDPPTVWLGYAPPITTRAALVAAVAARTGKSAEEVSAAVGGG